MDDFNIKKLNYEISSKANLDESFYDSLLIKNPESDYCLGMYLFYKVNSRDYNGIEKLISNYNTGSQLGTYCNAGLGRYYYVLGEDQKAFHYLNRSLEQNSNNIWALFTLGYMYAENGHKIQYFKVVDHIKSLDSGVNLDFVNINLGDMHFLAGNFKKAQQAYLESKIDKYYIFHKLGLIESFDGNLVGAIEFLKRSNELEPNYFENTIKLVELLIAVNQIEEAEKLLYKIEDSNNPLVNYFNGYIRYLKRDFKESEKYLRKSLQVEESEYARIQLATTLMEMKKFDEAFFVTSEMEGIYSNSLELRSLEIISSIAAKHDSDNLIGSFKTDFPEEIPYLKQYLQNYGLKYEW